MVYISRVRDGSYQFPSCSRLQSGCSSTSFSFKEVLPFYISGAISQMRNISLLEIKFVVPHTSPSYSNNTLKGGAATDVRRTQSAGLNLTQNNLPVQNSFKTQF